MAVQNIKNIEWIVKHDLCVGCGVCQDICPKQAIQIKPIDGVFRPIVDANLCINDKGCHRCRIVCPGGGVNLIEMASQSFDSEASSQYDKYIGHYINHYSGYSNNTEIRSEGASGGMTTQYLIYLLEKGYIQGAVVTSFCKDKDYWVNTFIANSKEDIISAKSSKYCPVTMAGIASQVKKIEGKVAIVGLPCHIHGLRKLAANDKKFADKVFAYVGLYCSCGRNFSLTKYVFESRRIDMSKVSYFTYRHGAGMGKMLAKAPTKVLEETFPNYYLTLRSFFNLRRCMYCVDHFAELADICFGDLHIGKYIEDKVGISSIVTRTKQMDDILQQMNREVIVTINPVTKEDLLLSQKYVKTKKHVNSTYMKIDKMLGRAIPVYDMNDESISIQQALKSYLVKHSQMFVGRHKSMHWVIRLLSKDMSSWK